jgi:acyl-coenzyme A thioesterase PaaI-like protein
MTTREQPARRSNQSAGKTAQLSKASDRRFHETCFACGPESHQGLQLRFRQEGNSICGKTTIRESFQSYDGIAHGGIVTTLLDAAMVRCLHNVFKQEPFTCKLDVRFRSPVPTNALIDITARIVSKRSKRCMVEGEIQYDHTLLARATGVFMLR